MARKKAKLVVVKNRIVIPEARLKRETKRFIDLIRGMAPTDPKSMEGHAFQSYLDAAIRYESAWAYYLTVPDKDVERFHEVDQEVARLQRIMFQAFDAWQATAKRSFHAPVEDVRQVIYDALMSNAEAMPGYSQMRGTERGAAFRKVADKLIEVMKAERVQVTEDEMDARYCDPCTDKLAA